MFNRGMDKEHVVDTDNGILLSSIKEQNCPIFRGMDEPRDCHTEQVIKGKQISYINAYMWNLEKLHR